MTSSHEKRQAKRAELVRRLAELTPKNRADALLDEVDGKVVVRSIPPEDVYSVIIDTGLVDSTDIVQLSTPEQFRCYVDLAAWQKDRVDPLEVLRWLRAARGDEDEDFIKKLQGLDIEVVELLYKKLTIIHDLEENPDVAVDGVTMETPDHKYLIEFRIDGPDEAALRRLTYDLTTHNPFEISRFLEAVRWEHSAELEEVAFQLRQARLEDLGFPPLTEAVRVFSWVDPDKVPVPARTSESGITQQGSRVDFVSAMFSGLDAGERHNLEGEVRYLVNCVLIAEGAEPGDPRAIRRFSENTRDTLDLGLEHLTGGNPSLSVDIVRQKSLRDIFQVGFSLTLKLKRAVEKMAKEPGAKFGETWLALDDETTILSAIMRKRPMKALKVSGADPVPFRSKKEIAEASALMERVRAQRAVFTALLGTSPANTVAPFGVTLAELSPQRLFAAVVARAEVDGVVDVAPFPAMRLQELCARLFEMGSPTALRATAGQRATALLSERLAEGGAEIKVMVDRVLNAMLTDLGPAWGKDNRVEAARVMSLPVSGELPL